MKNLKEKGITLVALVVTVIILLILAGVTISQVAGDNGLFSRVRQAVEKYKNASIDEELMIGELERYIEDFTIVEKEEGVELEIKPKLTVSKKTIKVDVTVISGEVTRVEYKLSGREEWETNKEDEKSLTYTFENLKLGSYYVEIKAYDKNEKYVIERSEIVRIGEITAQEKDVLEGKTYIAEDGSVKTGNMINHGTVNKELEAKESYVIEEGYYEGGTITSTGNTSTNGPHGKPLVTSVRELEHEKIEAEDRLGNPVIIPGQFKVVRGEIVEDGIVIEDKDGNQFVWIPVSNVDGSNKEEDLIVLQNGSKVEITLGRYTFSSDGTPTSVQKGSECTENASKYVIGSDGYQENTKIEKAPFGAEAKNLEEFVNSVKNNHGYYFGRYEASYGSGSSYDEGEDQYKPSVQKSIGYNTSSMQYKKGFLWNFMNVADASKLSQNMYNADDIESDLVNSYAWDTAVVYTGKVGNKNYANATRDRNKNTVLKNTGDTEDVVCNIYDMAGNLNEWTTEYFSEGVSSVHCTLRGGDYRYNNYFVAFRCDYFTGGMDVGFGFRPIIYIM